jgi:protoporphyrinogen oxidase/uncharacterized membrane protein YbhN (UPF0104 family)
MKVVVLGAGIAGLEFGRLLKESGKDFIILERESQIGGLARTIKTGDYLWDLGVHAMYSNNKEIHEYYHSLPLDYQHSQRGVKIFHSGKNGKQYLVDYPFEEGVKDLPLADRWDCVKGYVSSSIKKERPYHNLKDWIDNRLGFGIAKHFMVPYNKKIWDCDLENISMDLVSKKIHPTSIKNFILGALGKKIIGRIYQWKFIYPRKGVQKLMDHTAKDIWDHIRLDTTVDRLERRNAQWVVYDTVGNQFKADMVVSTIPLVELLKKVDIEGLQKKYDELKWNNTYFVMVGLKRDRDFKLLRDCHWAFFKENEIFYRITLMNNFSSDFLPTLIAEITNKNDVVHMSPDDIKKVVVDDLIRTDVIAHREDIAQVEIKYVEHTYPIPTVGVSRIKEAVTEICDRNNIFLIGRNGHWDYINMDGVLHNVRTLFKKKFSPFPYLETIVDRVEPKAAADRPVSVVQVRRQITSREKVIFGLKILGSLALCALLLRKVNFATLVLALPQANLGYLGLAFVGGIAFLLIRAYKWFYLIRPYMNVPKFRSSLVSYMFGLGMSIITPARIGEIVRITNIGIKERSGPIGLFLFDKFIDILIVTGLSLFGSYYLFPDHMNLILVLSLLGVLLLTFVFMRQIYGAFRGVFRRIPFGHKFARVFKTILALPWSTIGYVTFLTLSSYVVCIAEIYFLLKAFTSIQLFDVFKVHPLVMLTNLFPFTIGGLGLREAASIYLYGHLGIAEEYAFWTGFLSFIFNILLYGIAGIILINFSKRKNS